MATSRYVYLLAIQKHFDDLFPSITGPAPEVLAQAALFVVLRDQPDAKNPSPWTSLASRRFGGDLYERTISFRSDDVDLPDSTVRVTSLPSGLFDITVNDTTTYKSVPASLLSSTSINATILDRSVNTTIVSQPPLPSLPPSSASNTMERLHVFHDGRKITLVLPTPKWLLSLGGDILNATKGALRAPMPSLIVDLKVSVGDKVTKGQALVVLESMKTETVLRAERDGVVKAVGCKNGEMVEEGRELVDIEEDEL